MLDKSTNTPSEPTKQSVLWTSSFEKKNKIYFTYLYQNSMGYQQNKNNDRFALFNYTYQYNNT